MRSILKFFTFNIVICLCSTGVAKSLGYVEGEVIVKLKSENGSQDSFAFFGKVHSEKEMTLKKSYGKMNLYHFNLKAGQGVADAIQELSQDPNVEYAEPNYLYQYNSETNQIQSVSESDIQALSSGGYYPATNADIHAMDVWGSLSSVSDDGPPIVAVIDTGLDITHDAFVDSGAIYTNTNEIAGNGVDDDGNGYIDDVNGWNFVANTGVMYDDDGHGTHVSGIILGVGQDIFTAPFDDAKIRIMPLKFLNASGVGSTSDAIKAVYYATNMGAKVINNSWGGSYYSGALHEALAYAYSKGVTVVAAAGNNNINNDSIPMFPANYDVPSLISIAATTDADFLASFSNFGAGSVHVGAPGVYILSTIPGGGYGSSSGTSMAAPFVSGIAALMHLESPQMLGYQIKQGILSESQNISGLSGKVITNSRVDVSTSVNYAKTAAVDSSQPSYSYKNQDRDLASSLAAGGAGGCGTVSKVYSQFQKGQRQGPSGPETWYILMVMAVMAAPMMVWTMMRKQSPEAQRRYERFNINSQVSLSVGDKSLVGNISTISLGGAQLNTDALLEDGGIISMKISSPDGQEQIEVEGRVVWSAQKKAYGIQFADAKDQALSRIGQWTESLTRA